eukprot:gb/GECG01002624.1/.p1 GENE.gb/GECG01002624.1/~~gb/GECG01002624.1/.p1  ORF type:complete len:153 (+),score=12.90 gb/GECG01002624.1/:1-459(+)
MYLYLRKRPHCDEFLRQMSKLYEIYIFTASAPVYADAVIKYLDPRSSIIRNRYCCHSPDGKGKKLKALGANLQRSVLVDDSPHSVASQPDNGLLCLPFYGSQWDKELPRLQCFLMEIDSTSDDLRPYLQKWEAAEVLQKERSESSTCRRATT